MTDEPMTPHDSDLRGLTFMPLDVVRLRDSALALTASGDEFKAAVLLWCVAWHQTPAGSLPDDDRLLCRWSCLTEREWKKARAGALRGWAKCSDGRLYHDTVAEKAREAWDERRGYRKKRDADRARLQAWREGKRTETGDETSDETRFETLQEEKRSGVEGSEEIPPKPPEGDFEACFNAYPLAGRSSSNRTRSREEWEIAAGKHASAQLIQAAKAFAASDVAKINGGQRVPKFENWLRDEKFLAWMPEDGPPETQTWNGPTSLRSALAKVAKGGEDWVRAWIDAWTYVQQIPPANVLFVKNAFALDRIKAEPEAMRVLREHGYELRLQERAA